MVQQMYGVFTLQNSRSVRDQLPLLPALRRNKFPIPQITFYNSFLPHFPCDVTVVSTGQFPQLRRSSFRTQFSPIWRLLIQAADHFLKGKSNQIFDSQFFSSFKPAWATDQWISIFTILVQISSSYSNFSVEKTDLPGYHTLVSYVLQFWRIFIVLPGYDTWGD